MLGNKLVASYAAVFSVHIIIYSKYKFLWDREGKNVVLTPEEVSAYVLAKMKHTAEDYLGVNVEKAVVTVPA